MEISWPVRWAHRDIKHPKLGVENIKGQRLIFLLLEWHYSSCTIKADHLNALTKQTQYTSTSRIKTSANFGLIMRRRSLKVFSLPHSSTSWMSCSASSHHRGLASPLWCWVNGWTNALALKRSWKRNSGWGLWKFWKTTLRRKKSNYWRDKWKRWEKIIMFPVVQSLRRWRGNKFHYNDCYTVSNLINL